MDEGIPFLGFVVFPDHRRLKPRKGYAFQRRLRKGAAAYSAGQLSLERLTASVQGWVAHVRTAQTYGLRKKMLRGQFLHPPPRRRTRPAEAAP